LFTPAGIQNPERLFRSVAMVSLNVLSSKGIQGSHLNFAQKNTLAVLALANKNSEKPSFVPRHSVFLQVS